MDMALVFALLLLSGASAQSLGPPFSGLVGSFAGPGDDSSPGALESGACGRYFLRHRV